MSDYNEEFHDNPDQMIEDAFTDEVMASNEFYATENEQKEPETDASLVDNSHVEMEAYKCSIRQWILFFILSLFLLHHSHP
ncbi:MAG: hypothetical protein U5K84_13535 [Alkalibacterium sp.]|nr:hypothetical protein [Alkalibacterium sp.]MDZ7836191.1 hypothetical protein [Alkalibacterium sp.]